jgi:predicted 3-demethylubiquinone-9 3-methyltransferase (glyoxalase superfamily)
MWESKIKTFLLHKVGGNHREQPFPISISNHKSSTCSLYQAQEWKKNNCKVKNQEFEVEKERVTGWNKKQKRRKKENQKGGG